MPATLPVCFATDDIIVSRRRCSQGLVETVGRSATCSKVGDRRTVSRLVTVLRTREAGSAGHGELELVAQMLCFLGDRDSEIPRYRELHARIGFTGWSCGRMVVVMSVAHLFVQLQGPDEMPLQAQSSATARTCIPRERTAGLHCMSVVSSQGGMAANGQGSVAESTCRLVGRTRRLYKPNGCRADVRCQKTTGLFDGKARCESVDKMT
jgi:hypothetical protein